MTDETPAGPRTAAPATRGELGWVVVGKNAAQQWIVVEDGIEAMGSPVLSAEDARELCCRMTDARFPGCTYSVEPIGAAPDSRLVEALREIAAQVDDVWDDHCGHMRTGPKPHRGHEPTCPYDIARRALAAHEGETDGA